MKKYCDQLSLRCVAFHSSAPSFERDEAPRYLEFHPPVQRISLALQRALRVAHASINWLSARAAVVR